MGDEKRIVICLDGTANEPEAGTTNVRRLYDMLTEDESQVCYYDPGVGTLGDPSATNQFTSWNSKTRGLLIGHGVEGNVAQAYQFLANSWNPGDYIYIFGFSRGAFTARALAGLLRTAGLVRRQVGPNLTPYAMKLYTNEGLDEEASEADKREWWEIREKWQKSFTHPGWPSQWNWDQVHFLGLWDTVKYVSKLNIRAQLQEARWPFTRKPVNVSHVRHALSIDERRKKYVEYRVRMSQDELRGRDVQEVWFAGVHSDVGGGFEDDRRLGDISLKWMIDEATSDQMCIDRDGTELSTSHLATLNIDPDRYEEHIGTPFGEQLNADYLKGRLHPARRVWWFTGPGWRIRPIAAEDTVHDSVRQKMDLRNGRRYRPENLPESPNWVGDAE